MAVSAPLLSGDVRAAALHGPVTGGAPTQDLGHNLCRFHYLIQDRDFAQLSSTGLDCSADTFGTCRDAAIPASPRSIFLRMMAGHFPREMVLNGPRVAALVLAECRRVHPSVLCH